ncbi:MAG: hypothetical protein AAGC56_05385 [Pseudomonadota bacterium]
MCAKYKRFVSLIAAAALAGPLTQAAADGASETMGAIALAEADGGITDRAFVAAPPHYQYAIERQAGAFLDCGEGTDAATTDADGRDMRWLSCGVTLTETLFIPAGAESARIVVHY